MRTITRALLTLLLTSAVAGAATSTVEAQAAQAPSQNVKTIAGVLAKLNHFAGDAEKKTLQAIVTNDAATASEKTLAQALVNVQHTAAAADKAKLEALAADAAAPQSVRTVAGILAQLNHTPSAEEKAALAKIASAV
jgi:hypothetical protein